MKFSVTQNGKSLSKSKYNWDEKTKVFSTNETNLVLDFSGWNGVTFKVSTDCIFKTGSDCTFKHGDNCMWLEVGDNCKWLW